MERTSEALGAFVKMAAAWESEGNYAEADAIHEFLSRIAGNIDPSSIRGFDMTMENVGSKDLWTGQGGMGLTDNPNYGQAQGGGGMIDQLLNRGPEEPYVEAPFSKGMDETDMARVMEDNARRRTPYNMSRDRIFMQRLQRMLSTIRDPRTRKLMFDNYSHLVNQYFGTQNANPVFDSHEMGLQRNRPIRDLNQFWGKYDKS